MFRCPIPLILVSLIALSGPIARAGDTSKDFLEEAATAASDIKDDGDKSEVIDLICKVQAQSGDVDGAKRFADKVEAYGYRLQAYDAIGAALAEIGKVDEANKIRQMVAKGGFSDVPKYIAFYQAKSGDLPTAQATAGDNAEAIEWVARGLAVAGKLEEAKKILADDKNLVGAGRLHAYLRIAEYLIRSKNGDAAKLWIKQARDVPIPEPDDLSRILNAELAAADARLGDVAIAEALKKKLIETDDVLSLMSLSTSIAVISAETGKLDEAKAALKDKNVSTADVMVAIAQFQAKNGKQKDAEVVMESLESSIHLSPASSGPLPRMIGRAHARIGEIGKAAQWARSLKDPLLRANALIGIVEGSPGYPQDDFPESP